MERSQIRKEIAALINSIKEHSDNIGASEHIPQLELELILHKIERLYQKSIVYNYLHSAGGNIRHASPLPEIKELQPQVQKAEVKQEIKVDAPNEEIDPKASEQLLGNIKAAVDLFGAKVTPVNEKPKTEKKPEKKEEKKEEKKPEITNIQKPAIDDLRAAIGINDKFQFANELFGGNIHEYEIAIHQLNTAGSIASAMEYFTSLQPLYGWEMENATVRRLLDLVDRRYP